jgi:hypothetical protein
VFRLACLVALAGCGRFGFDLTGGGSNRDAGGDGVVPDGRLDAVAIGHDEDADGIRDIDDTCPHLVGAQTDTDGDKVGDLCDPNPTTPGDAIAFFYTMGPGDQPFTLGNVNDDGVWTQAPDGLAFSGVLGGNNNLFGHIEMPVSLSSARVALGIELTEIVPGSTSNQNQIALSVYAVSPNYYVELNQQPGNFDVASITYWDGGTFFNQAAARDLASGIHTGALFMQTTQVVNTGVTFDTGWPAETYTATVSDTLYQGATKIEMNVNNVHFTIRYMIIISSP